MVGFVIVSHSGNLAKSVVELTAIMAPSARIAGSAVMTTEMVIETFEGKKVEMVDCPLVEGAVVATIDSVGGMDFESIKKALAGVGTSRKF